MKFTVLAFIVAPLLLTSCADPTPTTDAGKTAAAAPRQKITGSRLGVERGMSAPDVKTGDANSAKGILGVTGQGSASAVVP